MSKFTPEEVVAAYQRLGMRAAPGSTHLTCRDGVLAFSAGASTCCPLGIMGVGKPAPEPQRGGEVVSALAYGIDWWAFTDGFDLGKRTPGKVPYSEEDFQLGLACRQAVIAAGLMDAND